jgi:hypothetical protein
MSRSKILAFIVLVVLPFVVALVGDAVAGEKFKGRTTWHNVKWEQINVPGEEGHVVAVGEGKGINSALVGNVLAPGKVCRSVGSYDMNTKTGVGSYRAYGETIEAEGDKYYWLGEGKLVEGKGAEGKLTILRGTGKYEGLQGKGTYTNYSVAPGQSYSDWEWEWEWPKR